MLPNVSLAKLYNAMKSLNQLMGLVSNSLRRQFPYQCQTTASYAWESTLGCVYPVVSESTTTWIVTEISSGSTYVTTSTDGHPGGMNAYSIQVRFQASDLTTATTTSTATSSQKVSYQQL